MFYLFLKHLQCKLDYNDPIHLGNYYKKCLSIAMVNFYTVDFWIIRTQAKCLRSIFMSTHNQYLHPVSK